MAIKKLKIKKFSVEKHDIEKNFIIISDHKERHKIPFYCEVGEINHEIQLVCLNHTGLKGYSQYRSFDDILEINKVSIFQIVRIEQSPKFFKLYLEISGNEYFALFPLRDKGKYFEEDWIRLKVTSILGKRITGVSLGKDFNQIFETEQVYYGEIVEFQEANSIDNPQCYLRVRCNGEYLRIPCQYWIKYLPGNVDTICLAPLLNQRSRIFSW